MKKKILAICLAVLTVAASFVVFSIADKAPAIADAVTAALDENCRAQDGVIYTLDDNSLTAIVGENAYAASGIAASGTVVIPDAVTKDGKTYAVREIGKNAFSGSAVKEVVISNSVTKIGELAFSDCASLERVAMGSGVTEIAGFAFWHCPQLVDVSLGQNVKTIGGAAFWSCPSLEVITLPQGLTTVMEQAFKDCTSLSVVYKADATAVAENAFEGIEKAPEIKNEYTPALYIPKALFDDPGHMLDGGPSLYSSVTVRVLLEGCAANVDISGLTIDGEATAPTVETGDTVYNGTIYAADKYYENKKIDAALGELSASMTFVLCDHKNTTNYISGQSCTAGGAVEKVCADCHRIVSTRTVSALGHDYVDFTVEPVCLDGGYTTHRCSRCGEVTKDSFTEATGHSFDDGVIRTMPTHSALGLKRFTCESCKRVDDHDIPVVGDANGDGNRNSKDIIAIMRYMLNISQDNFFVESANTTGDLVDGAIKINAKDIIALMRAMLDPNMVLPSTSIPTK